ncbi:ADP-ribosylation factor 4 [Psilocybe cubensis]|uniref:ADP-ribosylation factor 4 n=2 Tax=Psilocybe cubensis TaxID=181762 RepID=A0ACB8HA32_PSICU|nr:ADP-ribosylation factor 4 [Psilocybe cubensis]KAH9484776.1 ADP-ribosylation factor 4 [Psilocybe cubensis]
MSFIIRRLMDVFYPSKTAIPVKVLGLDFAGKSTLLYGMKGVVDTTIPTIGFSVETTEVAITNGQRFRLSAWDVGGRCSIGYSHPLFRHYLIDDGTKGIIWVVDAADSERLVESIEALSEILREFGDVEQKLPVVILANKADKPNGMTLDYVRVAFSKVTSGYTVSMFKTVMNNDNFAMTGLSEALDWLRLAIEKQFGEETNIPTTSDGQLPDPGPLSMTLATKVDSWLKRAEADSPPDVFLEQFNTFALPEWDHYTHIRIAYVILTKHGRKEGKDLVFKGLEKYISVSPQTKKKSFHLTMTYFWIQIVHFGIRSMTPNLAYEPYYVPFSADPGVPATPDEFPRFLLTNPHVADGNLWSEYYSTDVMMSPNARKEMVLPDKKPLPNLITLDTNHKALKRNR